jgi:hypothetical protein
MEVEMGAQHGCRRHGRRIATLAAFAALGVAAAGCGGGSPSAGVAQLATTATTATTTGANDAFGAGSGGGGPSTSSGKKGQASVRIRVGGDRKLALRYAQCMRSHGVTNFPDPASDGSFSFSGSPKDMPSFQAADQACRKLLPAPEPPSPAQMAEMRKQALKFAGCMRSHGFPQFPDPTFSDGGIQMRLNKNAGMDPSSPRFQRAQQACKSFLPGKVAAK